MEEIVSSWDSEFMLVIELATPEVGPDGERNPFHKVRATMSGPASNLNYNFRLEDANGKTIKFPVKLISDTTFDRGSPH